jgi:hypothetical protein
MLYVDSFLVFALFSFLNLDLNKLVFSRGLNHALKDFGFCWQVVK